MYNYTILIVDDEKVQREALAGFLRKKDYKIIQANSAIQAIDFLKSQTIDLVLTDLRMPEMDGTQLLVEIKKINPQVQVVLMTAYGTIETAIEAMKNGAADFITKPVDLKQLEIIITRALEKKQLVSENIKLKKILSNQSKPTNIISTSAEMEQALNTGLRAAPSKASVLIYGESGTGKELFARAIHQASDRNDNPFIAVNLAALPENLVESELFGYEKGSFTGATAMRKGRFEQANSGTLFIDEVGDIPAATQVKLLRVLQEQQFERIGGNQPIHVDVRMIAATHKNLQELIHAGTFRQDLYYRLNVVQVELPSLRERKSDIPVLVNHFIKKYSNLNGIQIDSISKEAMDALLKYNFPGNVRELENIIEQAVVLCRFNIIEKNNLPSHISTIKRAATGKTFQQKVELLEIELIMEALKKANWIQTKAAELLDMTERNLRYKMQKYDIKKPSA